MADFCMPSLGADMDSGTVVEWRVRPGDTVRRGDIVAVVDTDKSDIEVEVFEDGIVEELLVPEGEEVAVGTPLARIAAPAAPVARSSAPPPEPAVAPRPDRGRRRPASPLARRRARRAGLDLAEVTGSGPGGAVVAADLERHRPPTTSEPRHEPPSAPPAPPAPAPTEDRAADRRSDLRRAIGELMARSKREIPHYYLDRAIDLGAATSWLAARNADRPVGERILPAALLLRAVVRACHAVPAVNGHFVDGAFAAGEHVDLGVAISLRGGGLVAPAIRSADDLTVPELMERIDDLVGRARGGRLRASELTDPTITVTNLGDLGSDRVYGVIYPPQVAIVGFGRIADRPWAIDGMLAVRPIVTATLAADHRVSDGRDGARFLALVDQLLQHPEDL